MADADWREILNFSQKELLQTDKEKLCESLSWMEADDIELNFTDLKTLFRLAQDILKYKYEQVNNLRGQLETAHRKIEKSKVKGSLVIDSPTRSIDSVLETIAHQEEVIKTNKDILEQLYSDIAELEGKKNKLQYSENVDTDTESSKDALSQMNALAQMEHEVTVKNRHIRKLLNDVKVLEDENSKLREKVTILKNKLTESTQLIENLTEQLVRINTEYNQLKTTFGATEEAKSKLLIEVETLMEKLNDKDSTKDSGYKEIRAKLQHWKELVKTKKIEVDHLTDENFKLKEELNKATLTQSPPRKSNNVSSFEKQKIQEMQTQLLQASNEITVSANLIEALKAENLKLKDLIEETNENSISEARNESDDGKQKAIIRKLKSKIRRLTVIVQGNEEMLAVREKELAEIATQLQLLQTNDGIKTLVEGLKNKKKELIMKDDGIKSLVQEVNNLNQTVDELQLENESLRQIFNVTNKTIATKGILKKFYDIENENAEAKKNLRKMENKLLSVELDNHNLKLNITKLSKILIDLGYNEQNIFSLLEEVNEEFESKTKDISKEDTAKETAMKSLIEENEGLRKGLQDILNFLKDNSKSSSGVLSLECPSLEAVLRSLESRHAAGWFAPHMATLMELKEALGGRDALLVALHETRKETFDIMNRLSHECERSHKLQKELQDLESSSTFKRGETDTLNINELNTGEFGTWISDEDFKNIDIKDKKQIEKIIQKGYIIYEDKLKFGLAYFHNKFSTLFDKMTSLLLQSSDDQNKWCLQEEQYKVQIENLKSQLNDYSDNNSNNSSGLVTMTNSDALHRKCSYLEESYKYIRTLNENLKNEYVESKKECMEVTANYELQVQNLMLTVADLTDKLRNSIPLDLFWKQHNMLNDTNLKYRRLLEKKLKQEYFYDDLLEKLSKERQIILHSLQIQLAGDKQESASTSTAESIVIEKQLQAVCQELKNKTESLHQLQQTFLKIQDEQTKMIDKNLSSLTIEEITLMSDQISKLKVENKIYKDQYNTIQSKLNSTLVQVQDYQQRKFNNDIEINMLRHQILDLQSSSDNQAIVARLSGEILVAHLQATEMYKKIEQLNTTLTKEREIRVEVEEMLKSREKIFDVYSRRYESKFRFMYEVHQSYIQLYHGSIPIYSVENFLTNFENFSRNSITLEEKLNEIEELQSNLMIKHSVYDQILDVSKHKCLDDEQPCPHRLKNIVMEGTHSLEISHHKRKMQILEQSRNDIKKRCQFLEKTIILLNQAQATSDLEVIFSKSKMDNNVPKLELEEIMSDEEISSISRRSQTITLPKPQVLKQTRNNIDISNICKEEMDILPGSPIKSNQNIETASVFVQTNLFVEQKYDKSLQTEEDTRVKDLNDNIKIFRDKYDKKNKELSEALSLAQQRNVDIIKLESVKDNLETELLKLNENNIKKDTLNQDLRGTIKNLEHEIAHLKDIQISQINKTKTAVSNENKTLLLSLKHLENEKDVIVEEYKTLLNNERDEFSKTVRNLNSKVIELQSQLDRKSVNDNNHKGDSKETVNKYIVKNIELEDKCFSLQNELDGCKSELLTYQSEVDRWKTLAAERLTKMERLSSKLEERHSQEVDSYKAENQHWLTQLSETQREHADLRTRLVEQKALYVKQLADKDAHIDQLRSVINNLKSQIMSMQTIMSANDPSFDLSAIVEVDEVSDGLSQSDRLEIKFDSTGDLQENQEDMKPTASSTAIWQEPVVERLRREKIMMSKQNVSLRRHIKTLAARERRARLDAQNLKNQMFRISTSTSRGATAETTVLQSKIASLQASLTSARRDTQSSVALWDKWKRAQQSAERWQTRYEEKCQEVKKFHTSLNFTKSAITRLEKEKRVLLSRLDEVKHEKLLAIEKQGRESPDKSSRSVGEVSSDTSHISHQALLDRIQAQQRRIVALEIAENGNEVLVSEYEKALAEITALKGQLLKLESTLLETQIRSPINTTKQDIQPEIEYWKNYCDMLKEENTQLTLKMNAIEAAPSTAHQHRVNDLERTVLTLRGLVSKMQAEQKSGVVHKRPDSRPGSGRNQSDKLCKQMESYRIEIVNLKRTIEDKDLLLERSKEMLKIAAEREDDFLKENTLLRRQLDQLTKSHDGFFSA